MKIVYNGYSESGGIYRIINVDNERIYIGSTSCFRKRAAAHLNNLLANSHLNKFLQNDFNKCGTDAFRFEVLEVVNGDKEQRLLREQAFIDQHYDNQKQCYNLVKLAKDNRGGTRNRNEVNRLTDKRCKSPSEETLTKRSAAIRKAKSSPEARQRARENCKNGLWKNHNANVKLKNIKTQEEVVVVGSLREFAITKGLSYKALHLMVRRKTKSSGGWILV